MGKCDAALLTTFPYHRYGQASGASFSVASVPPQARRGDFSLRRNLPYEGQG